MRVSFFAAILPAAFLISGCVPKTEYDDQQAKLSDTQTKLHELEASSAECDKDTFVQLREQAQSLDLLTQELVDRNTELSKEVARLRVNQSETQNDNLTCAQKLDAQKKDCDDRVERTRKTDKDLIDDLQAEIKKLKDTLTAKAQTPKSRRASRSASGSKDSKAGSKAAKDAPKSAKDATKTQ